MDLLLKAKRAYQHRQENKKIDKSDFKTRHSFDKRLNESQRIIDKYPDRVPVICERMSMNVPQVDRKKYLCLFVLWLSYLQGANQNQYQTSLLKFFYNLLQVKNYL